MGGLIAAAISLIAGIASLIFFFAIIAVLIMHRWMKDDWLY